MTSRNKNKGNSGERIVADFLTELYQKKFMRVPSSGAFLGGANSYRKKLLDEDQISTFKADIIPPSNMKKLVIESKFYKDFPFHNLMKNQKIPILDTWISQAKDSSDEHDFWVCVFRINRKGSFVAFDKKYSNFKLDNYCVYFEYIVTDFEMFFQNNKDAIFDLVQT